MRIGFVGLGKLGLPCALALESRGHQVQGVEIASGPAAAIKARRITYTEEGAQDLLEHSQIRLVSYADLVRDSDLIFVAVQTPHHPDYEGVTPIPDTRSDFDYSYLQTAVTELCRELHAQQRTCPIAVISTVLPGTMASYVRPIIDQYQVRQQFQLVYNPFFIAMGTAIQDFLYPEFSLVGVDSPEAAAVMRLLYESLHSRQVFETTVENAELIKVAYNTFIGLKISFANTLMEICHKTPNTNCDAVSLALGLAHRRLMSAAYLRGGMGDGGGCHPRDNIALSWLAEKLELSHDLFYDVMRAREDQTGWLASLIVQHSGELPVILLGWTFKPGTNIDTGSPARLLSHMLDDLGVPHEVLDPHAARTPAAWDATQPACFFVSTRHDCWLDYEFPPGSVILDPFRYLRANASCQHSTYIPIGDSCFAQS